MFSRGLSLEQAPPITVIFRFFLTMPLFGLLLCGVIFFNPDTVSVARSPAMLTVLHLFFLGVAAMSMIGALFQMLPVLAGVVIKVPIRHSNIIHALLVAGTLLLCGAFYTYAPWMFISALAVMTLLFGYLALLMLPPLLRQEAPNATVRGMQAALGSIVLAVFFAAAMLAVLSGLDGGIIYAALREAHYTLALIGWVAFLIMAVAFQVIEMFYVTPAYPALLRKYGSSALITVMASKLCLLFILPSWSWTADFLIAAGLIWFALLTLRRLSQRKRPLADATLWFWRFGMGLLLLGILLWALDQLFRWPVCEASALIAFCGFVLSVISGMIYKIAPFLVWFHLNSQGYSDAPVMAEVITQRAAKRHFRLYAGAMAGLLGGIFFPVMFIAGTAAMAAAFALLGYHLLNAIAIYNKVRSGPGGFDRKTMMYEESR